MRVVVMLFAAGLGVACTDGVGAVSVTKGAWSKSRCVVVRLPGFDVSSPPIAFRDQSTITIGVAQRVDGGLLPPSVEVEARGFDTADCSPEQVQRLTPAETDSNTLDFNGPTLRLTLQGLPPTSDAGVDDAGVEDAGLTDGADAGTRDAGTVDSGTVDAGTVDAGTFDAGALDAGTVDAGAVDAGTFDAGTPIDRFVVEPRTLFLSDLDTRGAFQVTLKSQPTQPVTVSVMSQEPTIATVNVSSLTFTPTNWNTAQAVVATALPRNADAGVNASAFVSMGPAQSADPALNGATVPNVRVSNQQTPTCPVPTRSKRLWTMPISSAVNYVMTPPTYSVDLRCEPERFTRIGYCMELTTGTTRRFAYVEMDDFTGGNLESTGLPFGTTVARDVSNVTVVSNVETITPRYRASGNLELSPYRYTRGSDGRFDNHDVFDPTGDQGSFQVFAEGNTIFGWNDWATNGPADSMGLGDAPDASSPDWTEAFNGFSYTANATETPKRITAFAILAPAVTVEAADGGSALREGVDAGMTFHVWLTTAPSAPVAVDLSTTPADQVVLSPSSVTFTAQNWFALQRVVATAIDDAVPEGRRVVRLSGRVRTGDPAFSRAPVDSAPLEVIDAQASGAFTPSKRLVVLRGAQPASVSIDVGVITAPANLTLLPPLGVMATPQMLMFTVSNMGSDQTFTLTSNATVVPTCQRSTLSINGSGALSHTLQSQPLLEVLTVNDTGAWPTCRALRDDPDCAGVPSGVYTLKPGATAFEAYCDMETSGGGWTRVGYEPSGQKGTLRLLGSSSGTPAQVAAQRDAGGFIGPSFSFDAGHYTEVRVDWTRPNLDAGCGRPNDTLAFTATQEVFADSANVAIPVLNFTTSRPRLFDWVANAGGAVLCRAATSTTNPGDTSWAIKPVTDTNNVCGCNSMGWLGQGAFYGGTTGANCQPCGCFGGGWAGDKASGEQKGDLSANSTSIFIR